MLLNDTQIAELVAKYDMIRPFVDKKTGDISYGLSSYGYDIRLSRELAIESDKNAIVDPKRCDKELFNYIKSSQIIMSPHSFILGKSVEYFKMPPDIIGLCLGKSTYARCGVIVNITPLEPGWEGYITIEISNTSKHPVRIYPMEGIAQIWFFKGKKCAHAYNGKYQKQQGIVLAGGECVQI